MSTSTLVAIPSHPARTVNQLLHVELNEEDGTITASFVRNGGKGRPAGSSDCVFAIEHVRQMAAVLPPKRAAKAAAKGATAPKARTRKGQ